MNQSQLIVLILIMIVVSGVFLLMVRSWRRRIALQSALGVPLAPPDGLAEPFEALEGLHLATTPTGKPLQRIAVRPLEFRARGVVLMRAAGLELQLDGADPVFIPASDLLSHSRASWTIDRGVEEDGLNLLSWTLQGTPVDSYFRMGEPDAFDDAIDRVLSGGSQA